MSVTKNITPVTSAFCGDPAPSRSALGGWVHRGAAHYEDVDDKRKRDKYRRGTGKRGFEKRKCEDAE
jgi:hypothetical protein